MERRKSNTLIIILATSLIVLFLLSAGLRQLELLPGEAFNLQKELPPLPDSGNTVLQEIIMLILRGITALALVIFPIYLVYSLFTKEGRRWLLRTLTLYAVMLGVLYLLQDKLMAVSEQIMESMENMSGMQAMQMTPAGPPMEFEATPPDWVSVVASVVIGLIAAAALGLGGWYLWNRTRRPSELESLEDEARKAIDAIQAGGDLKDVILQCYRKMNEVVRVTRGIERDQAMTAEEFQKVLVERGLPESAVLRLTHLFEDVRYGGISFTDTENNQAVDSLNAIVTACRTLRGEI